MPLWQREKIQALLFENIESEQRNSASLSAFENASLTEEASAAAISEEILGNADMTLQPKQILSMIKQLPLDSEDKELGDLVEEFTRHREYEEKLSEIFAAIDLLEDYREEYENWTDEHPNEVIQRALALFY